MAATTSCTAAAKRILPTTKNPPTAKVRTDQHCTETRTSSTQQQQNVTNTSTLQRQQPESQSAPVNTIMLCTYDVVYTRTGGDTQLLQLLAPNMGKSALLAASQAKAHKAHNAL